MEGDAIGGSVNMVMKDAPEKEVFKVLGSLGYSKIFIDRKFTRFFQGRYPAEKPDRKIWQQLYCTAG